MASERDRRAIRLAMRKLYERYPEAFTSVMDDVVRNGKNWVRMLPPRNSKRVGRDTYAALLANYRNALALGWSRLDFFRKHAEEGCNWGGVYHGGTWASEAAIREQLKTAERLVKTDSEFAMDVDFWQEVFEEQRHSAFLWGKNT